MKLSTSKRISLLIALAAGSLLSQPPPQAQTTNVLEYIKQTWGVLTRSNKNLATAAVDPKFKPDQNGRWPVYIPHSEDISAVEKALTADMSAQDYKTIDLRALPESLASFAEPGLLYLPHPYVVPGGRFNEMYGWDSYFIQVGLLRDGELKMAKNMADNFLYEVQNYGAVLNANRTYYLTRSQPPFLTQMVLGVYNKTHDKQWLANALPSAIKYHDFWTKEPHLTPETGLSRYFDFGNGPAAEVLSSEHDAEGRTHYDLVKEFYRTHSIDDYDVNQYYDRKTDKLTMLFYKGDRSMRESGFDPSNRFGPFNIDIIHYDPVCLNSLLYLSEMQIAEIFHILGRDSEGDPWRKQAQERAARINQYMWDQQFGLYFDYNFVSKHVRHYPFLTTFYPLWAGLASKEQAAAVEKNLQQFEKKGGLETSTYFSGNQWDSPFGWAPLQMIAVEGLRRYGFKDDAERISMEWLSLVHKEFLRQGYIVEKYDVVAGGSNVSSKIHYGYSANQAGFGWTNAVFTELYDQLTAEDQHKLLSDVSN